MSEDGFEPATEITGSVTRQCEWSVECECGGYSEGLWVCE